MLLWDIIRDWFVVNIWGGVPSYDRNARFFGFVGQFVDANASYVDGSTVSTYVPIGNIFNDDLEVVVEYTTLGDWLSTTSTIIVLIMICIFFFICVRYLFKVGAGLFHNMRG